MDEALALPPGVVPTAHLWLHESFCPFKQEGDTNAGMYDMA